jgi:hypothetical protein
MEPSLHKIFIDLVGRDPASLPAEEEEVERA